MGLGDFFKNIFARSRGENHMVAYVIREHDRGRTLAEILEDPYLRNRCSEQERARLLDHPELIRALGDDMIESARAGLGSISRS